MKHILYCLGLITIFTSCEDVIDVELDEGRSQLVIDAFITNDSSIQRIRLTQSAPYFLNAPVPEVNNASVKIVGPNGIDYNFINDGQGNYTYNPNTNGNIDSTGFNYKLEVTYKNSTYTAKSVLNPVPVIDSLTRAFEESEIGADEGYYTQFWARDFAGRKDFYWIKAFKNGSPINSDNPSSLILSQDAAFGGSEAADGLPFILPLRSSITDTEDPFAVGDTSRVELLSINENVFEYLEQVTIQANNGGLFSTPPANVKSTIKDAAGNPQDEVLGVFSVSSISKKSLIVTPE